MLLTYLNFGQLLGHSYWIAEMMNLMNLVPMTVNAGHIQFDAHVTSGQKDPHKIVQAFLCDLVLCSLECAK
jgi:hypothetical protein